MKISLKMLALYIVSIMTLYDILAILFAKYGGAVKGVLKKTVGQKGGGDRENKEKDDKSKENKEGSDKENKEDKNNDKAGGLRSSGAPDAKLRDSSPAQHDTHPRAPGPKSDHMLFPID